tara:strand:+ start:1836 stop:2333 length:498 start_codon:yes stop_codon:yes gene_type:complete
MWAIIKFEKKKLSFLKKDLEEKLGSNCKFYIPKLLFRRFKKEKIEKKEFNLLGDYLFCYNSRFNDKKIIDTVNYVRGLKYVLKGFYQSQNEIQMFIKKCKISEDSHGYISEEFYDLKINSNYKFFSGPFTDSIFKIIQLQKNRIQILMGGFKTTVNKRKFLFQPV